MQTSYNFVLAFGLIVAMSAPEYVPTTGRDQFTPPSVVITPTLAFLKSGSGQ